MNLRDVLTARALAAWAGTDRLSALAYHVPAGPPPTDLAALFALLIAGDDVEEKRVRPFLARLAQQRVAPFFAEARSLVEARGEALHAAVSVLPLGRGLLVCDRLEADDSTAVVCWPDDSSYHLANALPPGRKRRWLDIATGSAFAPILRPELAESIVATDLNERAVRYARLGVELSGITHVDTREADLASGIEGTFDLVSCNAPIPAHVGPLWRSTADASLFARLFEQVPRVLAPGGIAIVHGALAAMGPVVADLPGERVVVSYVPDGGTQFGIAWWRPDAEARHVVAYRELTVERPHLTHADRLAALGDP